MKSEKMSDPLLSELLEKPVGPARPAPSSEADLTRKVEIARDNVTIEVRQDEDKPANEDTATAWLTEEGLNPAEWTVTKFSKSKYGSDEKPMQSIRVEYARKAIQLPLEFDLDELAESIRDYNPTRYTTPGEHGYLVLIGDMQFGKADGDGPAGTLERVIAGINAAADRLVAFRSIYSIDHIHIAWLGDHIEGFVSQGGANVWRTQLTLNEQIRLTRRVMMHALKVFAPLARRVTMAAVPGNHGESVRFEGTGITRYDDSHDTEALIAVADAAQLVPEAFGHVEFFVPQTDELLVVTEVAGTVVAHHHGHKWSPGKQFDWWVKQMKARTSPMREADILVAGHLHHEHFEVDGDLTFWGINAMESDSTWFRHKEGSSGTPGLHVGIVKDGAIYMRESIRFEGTEIK